MKHSYTSNIDPIYEYVVDFEEVRAHTQQNTSPIIEINTIDENEWFLGKLGNFLDAYNSGLKMVNNALDESLRKISL